MIGAAPRGDRRPTWRSRVPRGLECHELVHAIGAEPGGLPTAFQWRGRRYRIAAVDGSKKGRKPVEAVRVFTVRTTSGMRCELEHRPGSNVWMMSRVLPSP